MKRPVALTLGLDPRELPAKTFERYARREGSRKERAARAEAAWENFGKPGREPAKLGGVAALLARDADWAQHLKLARLSSHWSRIVGPAVGAHTAVLSLRDGILTIGADSPAWSTQLTYLIPQLHDAVRRNLEGLRVDEIRVVGPAAEYSTRWTGRRRR